MSSSQADSSAGTVGTAGSGFGRTPGPDSGRTSVPGSGVSGEALLRWLPVAVWVASMLNALLYLDRGWFPHDLGSVAHPAQRVLLGELPHRDFQDVYTGGLAFLNALAFRVLGVTAMSARWMALGAYALWVPAVWGVSRRLAGGGRPGVWVAAGTTLLAASWTLPMYAEGMPSWYILFLATFALLAFLRFREEGKARWLVLAGMAGGASVLMKITGLYIVAAGLLSVAWLESVRGRPGAGDAAWAPASGGARDGVYRVFLGGCAAFLAVAVGTLVVRAMGPSGLVRFAVPALAPVLLVGWRVGRARKDAGDSGAGDSSLGRFEALARLTLPYAAGVALAVIPFLAVYAAAGALDDLFFGTLVLPRRRLAEASWEGLRGGWVGPALALAAGLSVALASRLPLGARRLWAGAAVGAGTLAVAFSGVPRVYLALWQGLWWLPPVVSVAVAGAVPVTRGGEDGEGTPVFLALAIFGLASLVEIPFAAPIYFFFAAPLMLLAALGGVGRVPVRRAWFMGGAVLLLAFTGFRLNPGFVRFLGLQPAHHRQTEVLRIPRGGGLRVDAASRDEMETVVGMVETLAPGPYIYATPDAPELYVLTGRRNPTGDLFEFLDPHPETHDRRVLEALDRYRVPLVILNRRPFFSGPVSDELVAGLQARYPRAREVGRFLVVWKDSDDPTLNPAPSP